MKQLFKSKIGPEILLIVVVPFVCMFSFAYADGRIWPVVGMLVPLMLFVASIIFGTSYTIDGVELVIRAGLIRYEKIEYLGEFTCCFNGPY